MESRIGAYLILGCAGHSGKDGFVDCNGVSNPILDLDDLSESDYIRIIEFLDNSCELFDQPMYNYNKISNVLNMMHRDYGVIAPTTLFNIQRFLKMHKNCGIFLILILKEDYNNE